MHEEMRTMLNAYLDGELNGTRLREVKLHLASCETCRNELKELRLVSDLLRAAPVPEFVPAERFASNLALCLPRRNLRDLSPKPGPLAWWLIPAGLMAAWFFVQTVFTLSGAVWVAETSGVLGQAVNWIGGSQQTVWFAALTGLSGGQMGGAQPTLALLNELNVFGVYMLASFLWQALIVVLYWGWLIFWWFRTRPRTLKVDYASQ